MSERADMVKHFVGPESVCGIICVMARDVVKTWAR